MFPEMVLFEPPVVNNSFMLINNQRNLDHGLVFQIRSTSAHTKSICLLAYKLFFLKDLEHHFMTERQVILENLLQHHQLK